MTGRWTNAGPLEDASILGAVVAIVLCAAALGFYGAGVQELVVGCRW